MEISRVFPQATLVRSTNPWFAVRLGLLCSYMQFEKYVDEKHVMSGEVDQVNRVPITN